MGKQKPVAVVTGAAGAIGEATVMALVADHRVVALARTEESAAHLRALGDVHVYAADLEDADAVVGLAAQLNESFPQVAVLVHAAAIAFGNTLADTEPALWEQTFAVNVTAPALLTRGLLPALRAAGGDVIFINSGAGHNSFPDHTSYAASKHALKSVANSLRLSEPALRVTSIYPGQINSKMLRGLNTYFGKDFVQEKYIRPTSVAETIRFVVNSPADVHLTNIDVRPAALR